MIYLMFGIHNHQPVGNFDGVFKQTYKDCYLPFLNVLERFPKVKMVMHFTGPLLEWIEKNHPEYFDRLRKMLDRGQIEFMGGGFYEPILTVLHRRDALGQLEMMQEYIKKHFGAEPNGMWLAERVWEPGLPSIIAEAGLKYVTIDDTHFYYAGFKAQDMFGYYVTDDQGCPLNVFPIDKELRYRVPFSLPEETINYLRTIPDGEGVTLADDGEKFGVWPGTHKWVYTEGYLERLFAMLSDNSDWIKMVTFSEYMEMKSARGKVYLPTASYDEMMEWSLPVDSQSAFTSIVEEFKKNGAYARMRPYLRGGFWRNFLVKYPESNQMYSKMMYVSGLIEHCKDKTEAKKRALKELYMAQCNCTYWHGLFGGLYLNYLRHAVYEHLLCAEEIIDVKAKKEELDYNCDGQNEILFGTKRINAYFSPAYGGQLIELDHRLKKFNLSNVLTRRPEAYHHKLDHAGDGQDSGQPKSIHDAVSVKEEGLKKVLFYDWYKRNSFIDHILNGSANLDSFYRCQYGEDGDFVNQGYEVVKQTNSELVMQREGRAFVNGTEHALSIKKTFEIGDSISAKYEILNKSGKNVTIWFGVEFNFTLLAGNAGDRYYVVNGERSQMNTKAENHDIMGLEFCDEYQKFKVGIELSDAAILWRFPIETISHSESGLERTYQGSCIMPSWKIELKPDEKKKINIGLGVKDF